MYNNSSRIKPEEVKVIIYISLEHYKDFFCDCNFATPTKSDIHPDLVAYLESSVENLLLRKNLEIIFDISKEKRHKEQEKAVRVSYDRYYEACLRNEEIKIRRVAIKSFAMICFLMLLFSGYVGLESCMEISDSREILMEGVLIGGWVFIWEAIRFISHQSGNSFIRSKRYGRFANAFVTFTYKCV
jgi:hypothetical protein